AKRYTDCPDDATLQQVLSIYQDQFNEDRAPLFSDLVYSVLGSEIPSLRAVRHLTIVLFIDGRYLEASHFAQLWHEQEPASWEAARLRAKIAAERGDLPTAIACHGRMCEL